MGVGGIWRYRKHWDGLSKGGVNQDRGVMEMDWAMENIYLGDPGVDRHYIILS